LFVAENPAKTLPKLRLLVVLSLMVGMLISLMVLALRCPGLRGHQGETNGGQRQN
jgi:hypothetical protein